MKPDGSQSVPPEERLLQHIRGEGTQAGSENEPAAQAPGAGEHDPASAARRAAKGPLALGWSWVMSVNVVLGLVVVGEVAAWTWLSQQPLPTIEVAPMPPGPEAVLPTPVTLEGMPRLAAVSSRQMFVIEARKPVAPVHTDTPPPRPKVDVRALAARFKVVGIVTGDPSEAIIEDAKTKQTFFAGVGTSLSEGFTVKEIRSNRVILELDGQTVELAQ